MSVPEPAVVVDRLCVQRGGTEVLRGLSFRVERGTIVGLLGPSGSGKSTLMRSLVGVQAGVRGSIRVLGRTAGDPELRRRVGYVTQSASVYGDLTVRENVRYLATLLGAGRAAVERAIDVVDLSSHASHRVSDLSGGQRNRVSLAAALVAEPELLVLDEPTVGLDPVLRRDLWELFARLRDGGTTLLVSSHVMDEADHCDRLLLMRSGVVLADATPSGLLAETGASDTEGAFLALVEAGR